MPTIQFKQATTATPEQFIAGLTDFGPGRSEIWPNSVQKHLKVHDQGIDYADVTEGIGGVWERLHYDWSDPNHVVLTTTDSIVYGGRSGYTYTFTRRPDGTTGVDIVVVREGRNFKGRLLAMLLSSVGKRALVNGFGKTVRAIEARRYAASPADSQAPAMGLVC